jgi:hypothetical protein
MTGLLRLLDKNIIGFDINGIHDNESIFKILPSISRELDEMYCGG